MKTNNYGEKRFLIVCDSAVNFNSLSNFKNFRVGPADIEDVNNDDYPLLHDGEKKKKKNSKSLAYPPDPIHCEVCKELVFIVTEGQSGPLLRHPGMKAMGFNITEKLEHHMSYVTERFDIRDDFEDSS